MLYALIFFSVTSKYSEDEPIIYKLSEFKKTQVMKNQHMYSLLKIKETKYCSVHCHALEPSNFMTILNSKAQGDPNACRTYSYNVVLIAGRNKLPLISRMRSLLS